MDTGEHSGEPAAPSVVESTNEGARVEEEEVVVNTESVEAFQEKEEGEEPEVELAEALDDDKTTVEHVEYDDLPKALYIPWFLKWLEWSKIWLSPYVLIHTCFPWKQKDVRKSYTHQDAEFVSSIFITDVRRRVKLGQSQPVFRALANQFGFQTILIALAFAIESGSFLSTSILQEELLKWMVNPFRKTGDGYGWVGYMIMVTLIGNGCRAFRTQYTLDLGVKMKMASSSAIYEKIMTLHPKDSSKVSTGQLISFLGVDTKTLQTSALFLPWICWSVVGFFGSISLTIKNVGWIGFLSIAVILAIFPVQCFASGLFGTGVEKNLEIKDDRIKKTNEAMKGMQILKYFNWEKNSLKVIQKFRRLEVFWLLVQNAGFVVTISTISLLPILLSIVIFSVYQIDKPLTPQVVFPTLTYLIQLNYSVAFLPMQLSFLFSFSISVNRIQKFLTLEDRGPIQSSSDLRNPIQVKNGEFKWTVYQDENEKDKKKKKGKKKKKKKGKKVDDAKKEVELKEQSVDSENVVPTEDGTRVDTKQDDGVDNTETVPPEPEERLTFVQKLKKKFSKEKDVQEIFLKDVNFSVKQGELGIVIGPVGSGKSSLVSGLLGEMEKLNGSTSVSGRVAYVSQTPWIQNLTIKENILFGREWNEKKFKHILKICCLEHDLTTFQNGYETLVGENGVTISGGQKGRLAIARAVYADADVYILDDSLSAVDPGVGQAIFKDVICGYLKEKTRLFVTHQIPFCEKADNIVVVKNQKVVEQGSFDELKDHGYLQELLKEVTGKSEEKEETEQKTTEEKGAEVIDFEESDRLMTDEELERGNISIFVILRYIWAAGGPLIIPMLLAFVLAELTLAAPSLWLRFFVDDEFSLSTNTYVIVYCSLAAVAPIFIFLRDSLYHIHCAVAAERIHSNVLKKMFKAPMAFFHTTPLGRIMSRFSTDQMALDQNLVMSLKFLLSSILGLFVAFGIGIYATYWYTIAVVFCLVMYTVIGEMFRRNARELKRLENTARSPLFAQFSESVQGASTIRAYGMEKQFIDQFNKRNNYLCRIEFLNSYLQAWAAIQLDVLATCITVGAFLLAVWTVDSASASAIGLAITYATSLPFLMQGILEHAANSEREFSSVERMLYYAKNIPCEASNKGKSKPPKNWPEEGRVEFQDYSMRYRNGLPLVLKGVNFSIQGGERVGIVGRSGSGKSSLIQSLFRIVEAQKGRILIDDIDLSTLPLFDVRKAMTIIPQNPTIFSGTIRSNLDPFKQFKDSEIIDALKQAYLWDMVEGLDNGIDSTVEEDGSNLSAGERQLCCLARALLNDAQILLLDEVTSSVDSQSDTKIQEVVSKMRRNGKKLTTIAIAHRLNTIITYDKILVMKDGVVGEFGSPAELLSRPDSLFSSMVNDMGQSASAKLRAIALGKNDSADDDGKKDQGKPAQVLDPTTSEEVQVQEHAGDQDQENQVPPPAIDMPETSEEVLEDIVDV